jgi:Fe-S-cluster containining protein
MPDPNPRERLLAAGATQAEICTRHCGARCCRYISVGIPTPTAERDWDEIRWWLAHVGTVVTKEEDGWTLYFETRCRHLRADGACEVYEERMKVCREYDATDCEFTAKYEYEVELTSEADLADYLERKGHRRGARVAAAIRRAQATAPGVPSLHPVRGLDGAEVRSDT